MFFTSVYQAIDLLDKLLRYDHQERPTAKEAMINLRHHDCLMMKGNLIEVKFQSQRASRLSLDSKQNSNTNSKNESRRSIPMKKVQGGAETETSHETGSNKRLSSVVVARLMGLESCSVSPRVYLKIKPASQQQEDNDESTKKPLFMATRPTKMATETMMMAGIHSANHMAKKADITSNHDGDSNGDSDSNFGSDSSRIRGLESEKRLKTVVEGVVVVTGAVVVTRVVVTGAMVVREFLSKDIWEMKAVR
nr:hypothetical protein [Tanacetum cinerariifolium]